MPKVHDVGPVFVHRMKYPTRKHPIVEPGITQETDHPFRVGRSLVFRCPMTPHAVAVGVWGQPVDEESALRSAIMAKDLGRYSVWAS